jgi:Multiubiquitin
MKKIIVNGRDKHVISALLSYDYIVRLAGRDPLTSPLVSITWRVKGQGGGSLTPGQSVQAEDGMIFNAYVTGSA